MDFKNIQEKFPEAHKALVNYLEGLIHPSAFKQRDLYEFFDKQNIFIYPMISTLVISFKSATKPRLMRHAVYFYNEKEEEIAVIPPTNANRYEIECLAFEKAFGLLEKKLKP